MDEETKSQLASLHGETLALQTLLHQLLFHTVRKHPDPIRAAFDDAADMIEQLAITHGKAVRPEHLVKALGIVEEFRVNILGQPTVNRGGS